MSRGVAEKTPLKMRERADTRLSIEMPQTERWMSRHLLSFLPTPNKELIMAHSHPHYHSYQRPYGCASFLFDIFMVVITGGLWLIWIFIREMRNNR